MPTNMEYIARGRGMDFGKGPYDYIKTSYDRDYNESIKKKQKAYLMNNNHRFSPAIMQEKK